MFPTQENFILIKIMMTHKGDNKNEIFLFNFKMEEGKFYYSKIFLFNIVFLDFRVYINIGKTWEHITQFKFVKIPKIVNKFKNYSIMHSTTICALIFLAVFGLFLNQCGGRYL